MKSFSCLTISKRTGWEHDQAESIHAQTVSPEFWVIVSENKYSTSCLQSYGNTNARHIYAPKKIRASNLNASLNYGLQQIHTDYVIFYQDFIELPEDCFEKLLNLSNETTLITTCTPNYDGSNDTRYLGVDAPRACRPNEWEANVAIAPMKVIRELGGFDEEYDNGWSWDNVNLAERAAMLGYKFIIDESNRPKLLPHEQTSKLSMELNGERHVRTMEEIRQGKRPLKCTYL